MSIVNLRELNYFWKALIMIPCQLVLITLQETWTDNESQMNFFNLSKDTMVYEDSCLSKHG